MIYIRWGYFREDRERNADPKKEMPQPHAVRQNEWEKKKAQMLAQKRLTKLEEEQQAVQQSLERSYKHKRQMEQELARLECEHQENMEGYTQRETFLASIRLHQQGEEGGEEL